MNTIVRRILMGMAILAMVGCADVQRSQPIQATQTSLPPSLQPVAILGGNLSGQFSSERNDHYAIYQFTGNGQACTIVALMRGYGTAAPAMDCTADPRPN